MKKLSCLFISLFILVNAVSCYGYDFPVKDAEKKILARFTHKDEGGNYQIWYNADILLSYEKALKFAKAQNMKITLQEDSTWARYKGSGFVMDVDKNVKGKEGRVMKVGLIKRYYRGIVEIWTDKRKGCEDKAYATYKTETIPIKSNIELFNNIGVINAYNKNLRKNIINGVESYVLEKISSSTPVSKMKYYKDSRGNWK